MDEQYVEEIIVWANRLKEARERLKLTEEHLRATEETFRSLVRRATAAAQEEEYRQDRT